MQSISPHSPADSNRFNRFSGNTELISSTILPVLWVGLGLAMLLLGNCCCRLADTELLAKLSLELLRYISNHLLLSCSEKVLRSKSLGCGGGRKCGDVIMSSSAVESSVVVAVARMIKKWMSCCNIIR